MQGPFGGYPSFQKEFVKVAPLWQLFYRAMYVYKCTYEYGEFQESTAFLINVVSFKSRILCQLKLSKNVSLSRSFSQAYLLVKV